MNIAFPALLILCLILPGMVFRYAYARGSWAWTSPVSFRNVSDELAHSVIFAVGLHCLWLTLASWSGHVVDLRSLIAFITGNFGAKDELYEPALASVVKHPIAIASYFLTLNGFAGIAGILTHITIRHTKLDLKTQFFRFKNEWYYLLSGEVLSFGESGFDARTIDGVFLSAVVDHGKDSYLYRGVVEDWSFDAHGELECVRLSLTHRRKLEDDDHEREELAPGAYVPPDDRYYDVRGDLFVMRYSEMKTRNLDYFELTEEIAQ